MKYCEWVWGGQCRGQEREREYRKVRSYPLLILRAVTRWRNDIMKIPCICEVWILGVDSYFLVEGTIGIAHTAVTRLKLHAFKMALNP